VDNGATLKSIEDYERVDQRALAAEVERAKKWRKLEARKVGLRVLSIAAGGRKKWKVQSSDGSW